jgi:hypothetical protein
MTHKADAGERARHWATGLKVVGVVLTCWLLGHVASAQALGTAFTYQGQLKDSGLPATGVYDFEFKLFDASTSGGQVGSTVALNDVAVSLGVFSVKMVLDTLSDTAVFDQQGWVAGAFPNMEEHMRSLANGQNSLVCPLGSNISKFPSTFNHAGTAFPGGIHCFQDSISLPVWCCRNKS